MTIAARCPPVATRIERVRPPLVAARNGRHAVSTDVRNAKVVSTGRRNTGAKSFCWGFKLQGLTWSFVELTSHFVQIGLRVHRQVGALWKVLSQQAIGVLVRPALPRALRITKIYVDFGRQRKATMIRKFLSPIPGQGLIQLLW